jgi:hypothetical protein
MSHPRARIDGLLIEHVEGETLVYDTAGHEAHCLDSEAASVWEACDGLATVSEIAATTGLPEAAAAATVRDLAARHLLEPLGVNRRDLLRTVAIGAGAVAVGVPVIRSIVVPTAAQAASCIGSGQACVSSAQCCSGLCAGTCA